MSNEKQEIPLNASENSFQDLLSLDFINLRTILKEHDKALKTNSIEILTLSKTVNILNDHKELIQSSIQDCSIVVNKVSLSIAKFNEKIMQLESKIDNYINEIGGHKDCLDQHIAEKLNEINEKINESSKNVQIKLETEINEKSTECFTTIESELNKKFESSKSILNKDIKNLK